MAAPVLFGISPQAATPGTWLRLHGQGLLGPLTVVIGGAEYLATGTVYDVLEWQLPSTVPFGTRPLAVKNADGQSTELPLYVLRGDQGKAAAGDVVFFKEDYSLAAFAEFGLRLLPRGIFWNTWENSNLHKIFQAFAAELLRVFERARQLLQESWPLTAVELLDDWEKELGLPRDCWPSGTTNEQRQSAIYQLLTLQGGASVSFFIELARQLGFQISIKEFTGVSFRAGISRAGDAIDNAGNYYWQVSVVNWSVERFRAGISTAGTPLVKWSSTGLECLFEKLKPAHTVLQFVYISPDIYGIIDERTPGTNKIMEMGAPIDQIIAEQV